ncbi:uncharacterized protein LOC132066558 [Lycium ferocissimum]|uniref:uncharacterized protein LOC132066558 n=1 Tax=Lycium ferocissimum TaxID=112874 RepID=UPI002815425D|nr:uncharacterized protein LOC132066558 [Lycium ferocissimum]
MDDPSQRENLFHSKCIINQNTSIMIIDSGSCANVASTTLVDFLKLPTTRRENPYKLQWLNECGELKVTRQAIIKFAVGKYHDEVLCDVVPMQACHLLLGRPWQYDRSINHNGRTSQYTLVHNGVKHVLNPMTPSQVGEIYNKMRELKDKGHRALQKKNIGEEGVEESSSQEVSGKKGELRGKTKVSLLTNCGEIREELGERQPVTLLMHRDYVLHSNELTPSFPSSISSLLHEFDDVFPTELPKGLPPLRGIEHQIDFVLGFQLPNKSAYRANLDDTKELQRQVDELLKKGVVREIVFLGFVVNSRGVEVDESKIGAIKNWPTPKSIGDIRSFHGLDSFYRRSAPLLQLADFDKNFEIECDASKVGIGAVLMQDQKPITYFSEKLKGAALNYSTYDLELYALIRALANWQHYLWPKDLNTLYPEDPVFAKIFLDCEEWERERWIRDSPYSRFDGFLFKNKRLCVPMSSWRELFVREAHNGGLMGHFGIDKTFGILEEQFY